MRKMESGGVIAHGNGADSVREARAVGRERQLRGEAGAGDLTTENPNIPKIEVKMVKGECSFCAHVLEGVCFMSAASLLV